jgi:SAM-dependent methyltransferase
MKSPITKNENVSLIREIPAYSISEKWIHSFNINVGDKFRSNNLIQHWRCNETGLEWYAPTGISGDGGLYEQLEKIEWYYMPDKWEFNQALRYINKNDRVLEAGVGPGFFLKKARDVGAYIEGVELNKSAAKKAIANGFSIYQMPLQDLRSKVGAIYDVVCSFQVLEHIEEPGEFIQSLIMQLKIGGKLILSVPDAEFMNKIDPNHESLLNHPPHHVSHWDLNVFLKLEKVFPIEVIGIHREALQFYHVDWYVHSTLNNLWNKFTFDSLRKFKKIFLNRFTTLPFSLALKVGLRRFISGHTVMVVYKKTS